MSDGTADPGPDAPATERLKYELREMHRMKFGTDYCWVNKYGQLRVLCPAAWKDIILYRAACLNVSIDEWYTYE